MMRVAISFALTIQLLEALSQPSNSKYAKIQDLIYNIEYDKAIRITTKILDKDSTNGEALILRAKSFYYVVENDKAYRDLVNYSNSPDFDSIYVSKFDIKGL